MFAKNLLFPITTFLSSALILLMQPMISKMVLPLLGGSASVWTVSMLFFQGILVLGYLYAHLVTHFLPPLRALLIHFGASVIGLCLIPVQIEPPAWDGRPLTYILAILSSRIGFQLLVLSSAYPLLLKWWVTITGSAPFHRLFLAQNLGGVSAIIAYPLLIEPYLGLKTQNEVWSVIFLLVVVFLFACNLLFVLSPIQVRSQVPLLSKKKGRGSARLPWLLLALCPTSLTLGLTTHLSSHIAPIPLLWMTPLLLYSLSFIVAFCNFDFVTRAPVRKIYLFLLIVAIVILALDVVDPLFLIVPLHLLVVFCADLLCHLKLAHLSPREPEVTLFYLYLVLGSALGAAFNTFIAPSLFATYTEYPLMLIAAAALSYIGVQDPTPRYVYRDQVVYTLGVVLAGAGIIQVLEELAGSAAGVGAIITLGLLSLIVYTFRESPYRFVSGCLALLLAGRCYDGSLGRSIVNERNFFGSFSVRISPDHTFRYLVQNGTIHGIERVDARSSCIPLAYYHPTGPAGTVLRSRDDLPLRIAILGLGTGSLICYGRGGDTFRFYEINDALLPLVRKHFSYLDSRPEVSTHHIASDGRLALESESGKYDVIVVDTFSSENIPHHLITLEAFQTYLAKLKNVKSFILVHVSNPFFDLIPVVASGAQHSGLHPYLWDEGEVREEERRDGKLPSRWILLRREKVNTDRWHELTMKDHGWRDDYVNLLGILK